MTPEMITLIVEGLLNAVLGFFSPFLLERLKGSPLGGAKTLQVLSGILGTGIAFGVNYLAVLLGLSVPLPATTLFGIGWGVNQTLAQIGYRTLIKKEEKDVQ